MNYQLMFEQVEHDYEYFSLALETFLKQLRRSRY